MLTDLYLAQRKKAEGWKSRNTTAPFLPREEGRSCASISTHTVGEVKTAGLRNSVQLFAGNNHLSDRSRGIQKRNMERERDMASNSFLCPIAILMKSQNLETGCYGT